MSLTSNDQLLDGGVVAERLRKRPGPVDPDAVACEGTRHTHTHTQQSHQCKEGGRERDEREPRFSHIVATPHAGAEGAVVPHHWILAGCARCTAV